MSRRVEREFGARFGAGAAMGRDDRSLITGLSVDGQPPRIREGDTWQPVARIKCGDCSTVATVAMVTRPGRETLLVAETQVVENWDARPVQARTARVEVVPSAVVVADCPAHGAVEVSGDEVLTIARRGAVAVAQGAGRTVILNARPTGRREPLAQSDGMTMEECARWLGWDTPTP